MAHELELRQDGTAKMFYVHKSDRDVPWHKLGTPVPDALTAKEALVAAGLDWNVSKVALKTQEVKLADGTVKEIDLPDWFATIRDSDGEALGVVKGQYQEYQNHEHFAFMDAMVDGGLRFDTAGALYGGRQVFCTAKFPDGITVGGVDPVEFYFSGLNSHDGSRALTAIVSPIVIVCANTAEMADRKAKSRWTMRHDQTLKGKVEEARRALGLSFKYIEEFEKAANDLANEEFSDSAFEAMVAKLLPVDASNDNDPNRERQAALIGVRKASANINDTLRGTKWGAWNAVTEYGDWLRSYRQTSLQSSDERRFTEIVFGTARDLRDKSLKLLTAKN